MKNTAIRQISQEIKAIRAAHFIRLVEQFHQILFPVKKEKECICDKEFVISVHQVFKMRRINQNR